MIGMGQLARRASVLVLVATRCRATAGPAAAATAGPVDLGGGKCGASVSSMDEGAGAPFNPEMLRVGNARGLAWTTHWGADGLQPGFVPQDFGEVKVVPQFPAAGVVSFDPAQAPLADVALGFNEPDQFGGGGWGMSVQQALDEWMLLAPKTRAAGYTKLVAPSIAQALPERYTGVPGGNEWLPEFLERCLQTAGCAESISYLGFHMYEVDCSSDPAKVKKWNMEVRVGSMKKLMAEFNGKGMHIQGLWLTEFAGRSDGRGLCRTLQQQRSWMETVVPMLNAEPAVAAYSWFSYGASHSRYFQDQANLWDYGTNQLTELGEAYFATCVKRADAGGSAGAMRRLRSKVRWVADGGAGAALPVLP